MSYQKKLQIKKVLFNLLISFTLVILLNISIQIVTADDIEWDVKIDFIETSGKNDYISFGEASNASDNFDTLDIPDPPGGVTPSLNAYFQTTFPYPHNDKCCRWQNWS